MKERKYYWLGLGWGVLLLLLSFGVAAVDVLNCSKCHQHDDLKILTKEGAIRDFQVNPEVFNSSAHQKLTCQTCHSYITKTPHDPLTYRKVDCAADCHMEDETFSKEYSHQKENSQYVRSVHGEANEDSIGCVACHIEHSELRSAEFSPVDINDTCTTCHQDTELMAKHKIPIGTVDAYLDSFHGKAVNFEVIKSATCVSCHNSHDIKTADDANSSIHAAKKTKTCQTADCHPGAVSRFGQKVNHQLYRGTTAWFLKNLGTYSAYLVFIGVGIMLFHYVSTFLRKLSQENWQYVAAFIYIVVLTIIAPYILRFMMALSSKEIPFNVASLTPEYKSFCRSCHGVLPHQKNLVLRAFMNRHSRKLACETCHIKRVPNDDVDYLWYNGKVDYLLDFRGVDFDNGNKVMPYKLVGTKKIIIEMQKDGTLPLSYTIDKKGLGCERCHIEEGKGVLNFTSLGFTRTEIKNLQKLEEFEMLTKEKVFNLPTLW